jgi:hypothetical protein
VGDEGVIVASLLDLEERVELSDLHCIHISRFTPLNTILTPISHHVNTILTPLQKHFYATETI